MAPTARFPSIPLNVVHDKTPIIIDAPYFRVDHLGSAVLLYLDPSQTEGVEVTQAGQEFDIRESRECEGEKFSKVWISSPGGIAGEGLLKLFISGSVVVRNPSGASAGTRSTVLAHLVHQNVNPAGAAINVRNILMSSLSSATDFVSGVSGAAAVRDIERDAAFPVGGTDWLDGLELVKATAGAAGQGRAYYQNLQIPITKYLNPRSVGVPPFFGIANDYFEQEDDVAAFLFNGGGVNHCYAAWGIGNLQEDLGEMKGQFCGFYRDLTSPNWQALIYSNPGGAPIFHLQTGLAGYTAAAVRKLMIRIGVKGGARSVEFIIDGQVALTFAPPVAAPLATNATWCNGFPFFSTAAAMDAANGAAIWSLLGVGGQLRVVSTGA